MSRIVFFSIPAHGHINPTLGVVRELICRGNDVWYYSYDFMAEKIRSSGARFVSCDQYDPQTRLDTEDAERVCTDLSFSVGLIVDMTLALDRDILNDMEKLKPDVIVADSMAMWGKLIAGKLGVPFVSSTTTFAFNKYSAKVMGGGGMELISFLRAMPGVNRHIRRLRAGGYNVKNVFSIIGGDDRTSTIVYTAPEFQPRADTFSDKYAFVGAVIRPKTELIKKCDRPTVYVSLGTVLNRRPDFYRECIAAFRATPWRVIMSVGEGTDIQSLGDIPGNITVKEKVDQTAVLEAADAFVTHCGMNSVNEALYFGVPMALFPMTPEQGGVANRVRELGAGVMPKKRDGAAIRAAVAALLENHSFRRASETLSVSFRRLGGAAAAADAIEKAAAEKDK